MQGLELPAACAVENPPVTWVDLPRMQIPNCQCIQQQLEFELRPTEQRGLTEKSPHVREPMQLKPALFQGQLFLCQSKN